MRYRFIAAVLERFRYTRCPRADKGLLRRYLALVSGYSRAQLAGLLRRHAEEGVLAQRYAAPKAGFRRRYTAEDVALENEVEALLRSD